MLKPALAMFAGVLALLALSWLPGAAWLTCAALAAVLALAWRRSRWLVFLPLGFVWCWQNADERLTARLDPALEGRTLSVSGWVHSLPETHGPLTSFEFELEAKYPGMPVLSGALDRFPEAVPCIRGQEWDWDGVHFAFLYPDASAPISGNPASCVLKVTAPGGWALLTGDIMKKSEKRLLELDATELASELLVAPHHGSNSSSTAPFVAAVSPGWVLFPVGYRNRWSFPKPEVVERYRAAGAMLDDSVTDGAIRVRFRPGERPVLLMRWRLDAAHLWTER